jgi:hypothetical protein
MQVMLELCTEMHIVLHAVVDILSDFKKKGICPRIIVQFPHSAVLELVIFGHTAVRPTDMAKLIRVLLRLFLRMRRKGTNKYITHP